MVKEVKTKSNKTLKTFNLDEEIYNKFSQHCKSQGLSMSKRIENFLKQELEKLSAHQTQDLEAQTLNNKEHSFKKYC
jgi:negative regulator of replication initiation